MALEALRTEQTTSSFGDFPVKWGGIFAGSFITVAFGLLFMLLGSLIGLPSIVAINPMVPESISNAPPGDNIFLATWIYTLLTWIAAFFIGGFCTTRMNGIKKGSIGALYGLSSWALVILVSVLLITPISSYLEQLLAGSLPTSSQTLVFGILSLGLVLSTLGGSTGRVKRSMEHLPAESEGRLKSVS